MTTVRHRRAWALTAVTGLLATALTWLPGLAAPARAVPTSATDSASVPHYFGPWPNWANSPLTTPQATVKITGDGSGATATASVDPLTGGVSAIDVTDAGSGYTTANVAVTGLGTGAAATAKVTTSASVTGFTVGAAGGGYSEFAVTVSGGAGSGATAEASGGVDAVSVSDGGSGYTNPTVQFGLPELADGVQATGHVASKALGDAVDGLDPVTGAVSLVVVDTPGSGYLVAPGVSILNGTALDPVPGATPATAAATLELLAATPVAFGSGYTSVPTVSVTDPTGSGAGASLTAQTDLGAVTKVTVTSPGSGYLKVGLRKFVDGLPAECDPSLAAGAAGACPADPAKYVPVGVPAAKTYSGEAADEYVIGLVQYRTSFSSDLPPTLVRGYVQVETPDNASWSRHYPLTNELLNGTKVPVKDASGAQVYGVTPPQWLGPYVNATKNRPVRVVFHNYLPNGKDGNLYLPTDTTMMGSGMGPMAMSDPVDAGTVTDGVRNPVCTDDPNALDTQGATECFPQNRALLHLHGGTTPWISDGTPHQWITPAGEQTTWPQGVSVQDVPDMADGAGAVMCDKADDGCTTFYYTNQQSARMLWYHDHSWGVTRLNVYVGEAGGYTVHDDTEKALQTAGGIPAASDTIPLVVQDRTFVPDDAQLRDVKDANGNVVSYGQDPTWDAARWGGKGSFWYHHVYMPSENAGAASGQSGFGRWTYGPWFTDAQAVGTKHGPIANPYYDPACKVDVPSTWTYQVDPFCEPQEIPGTPNVSAGMEQFNDTPIVNGVAYPKLTLQPKSYRFQVLNASNDRFWNLQWYLADPNQGNGKTEVALKPDELAAAQTNPDVSPTPVDANNDAAGPDWVQIGSEGGFLPAPTVVDGQQPMTYVSDPNRIDLGNSDKHSMLLGAAERADAVVDFSKFAGKTLILYNDAAAPFPGRGAEYDYYTGGPDLRPSGAPSTLPGYGPNTRTVMQVTIAATAPAPAFDLAALQNAFAHKADGSGAFEAGQHPVIVGQAAYNSAYGTSFTGTAGDCTANGTQACDGYLRVTDTTELGFNTLAAPASRSVIPLQPKAIHDELGATTYDEYGRMQANMGVEHTPPKPGAQNVSLYPYTNPVTEIIDGTNLTAANTDVAPITSMADGTQIWRITHNGVDTHPIHFHLFDVQLLNRVTWDNQVLPPDPEELGWKDTIRISPFEDTVVALRPVVPQTPFEVPNAIRDVNPMMPKGSTAMFNNLDSEGNPIAAITNQLTNFGWEYVWHCHILSHEEMDMMRPMSLVLPPRTPDALTWSTVDSGGTPRVKVGWQDNSITETSFDLQRRPVGGSTWTTVATSQSPLGQPNVHGARTLVDPTSDPALTVEYRVAARNTVGYGNGLPATTASSTSTVLSTADRPAVTLAVTATDFGQVAVGTTPNARTVTLTNSGSRPLTVTGLTLTGADKADFTASGCVATVPAGGTCSVVLTFTPSAVGARSATLTVASDAPGVAPTVALSGTGIQPEATLSATSASFGSVNVGTTSAKTVTVTNTGTGALTVRGLTVAGADAADFTAAGCTAAVPAGGTCTLDLTFTPAATGARSATLTVVSDAATAATVALSGTGVQPVATLSATSLAFGSVGVGTVSTARTLTVTNSGTGSLDVGGVSVSGANAADFTSTSTCTTLAAGASCTVSVTFAPGAVGVRSASLAVATNAGTQPTPVALSGTGVQPGISADATSVAFGAVTVGTTPQAQTVTVTNSGTAPLTVSGLALTGANAADFTASGCAAAVAPGGTCSVVVTFTPGATGARAATLTVASNAPGAAPAIALSGTGVQALVTLAPASLAFGSVNVGATATAQTVTVSNPGTAPLTVTGVSVAGANAADFTQTNTCATAVAPGGTCTVSVSFTPAASGARAATLAVATNASVQAAAVPLTGTGTAAGASLSATSLTFGTRLLGSPSGSQAVTVTNTGNAPLLVSSVAVTGANPGDFTQTNTCTSAAIAPAGTCTVSVTFTPSAVGARSASVDLTTNTTPAVRSIAVTGTGTTAATATPASLAFAGQNVNTISPVQNVTVRNTGTAALTFTSVTLGGTNPGDFLLGNGCFTVAVGATCTVSVQFWPKAPLARSATVDLVSANGTLTVPLSGTGLGAVASMAPTTLAYGAVVVGKTSPAQTVTLTNTGNAALTNYGVWLGGWSGEYAQTNTCPVSIPAGSSCTITVTAKPTFVGDHPATVNVTTDVGIVTANLTVTGIQPQLVLSPTFVAFPTQALNVAWAPVTVTVSNPGTAPLTVSKAVLAGLNPTDYTVVNGCTAAVAPGSTCALTVGFKPAAGGYKVANLVLTHDATSTATTTTTTVPLSGFANPAAKVPGVTTLCCVYSGNASAQVYWYAPLDGGSPVTQFVVQAYKAGTTTAVGAAQTTPGNVYTLNYTGLTNGTAYQFKVAAVNAIGTGPQSTASASVTPATTPGLPAAPTLTQKDNAFGISWTAPADTGGSPVTGYWVRIVDANGFQAAFLTTTGATTASQCCLLLGSTYRAQVAAVNALGVGSYGPLSAPVVYVANPQPPLLLSVVPGAKGAPITAKVTWLPIAGAWGTGGLPLTGFVVTAQQYTSAGAVVGAPVVSALQPPTATVLDMTVPAVAKAGNTYRFSVQARNAFGTSPASGVWAGVVPA